MSKLAKRFRVEGVTDERGECDCCGRTNLKRTVVLFDFDAGDFTFYGTSCAARAMGATVEATRRAVVEAERAKRDAEAVERARVAEARRVAWVAFLVERTGGMVDRLGEPDVGGMIAALGGFAAARAEFTA
ncbi:MAG: hypothetical protein KC613_17070 [Myxococcales bacterium]|nr:hypothetical protein [Myxococcales bacterium]